MKMSHGPLIWYFSGALSSFLKLECYSIYIYIITWTTVFKPSSFVFHWRKKLIQGWNDNRTSKWQNELSIFHFHFRVNYPFKDVHDTSSHIATHTSALAEILCGLQIKLLPWWNYKRQIKWLAKAATRNGHRQNPNAVSVQKKEQKEAFKPSLFSVLWKLVCGFCVGRNWDCGTQIITFSATSSTICTGEPFP